MQCHWNAVHVLYRGDLLPFFFCYFSVDRQSSPNNLNEDIQNVKRSHLYCKTFRHLRFVTSRRIHIYYVAPNTQVVTRKHTKHKVEFKLVQKHYYTLDFCLVPMLFLSAIDFSSGSDIHTNVIRDPFTAITSSHYAFPEITLMRLIR